MRAASVVAACLMLIATVRGSKSAESAREPGRNRTVGGVIFAAIPGGEFVMGDDASANAIERPAHTVAIDAFWMAQTELTLRDWKAFLNDTGSKAGRSQATSDDHPVVSIAWDDARAYCEWFSKKHGVVARLPTEAEWEYAARGGLPGKQYPNGNTLAASDANVGSQGAVRVASYPSNGYGLFDMAGNVSEWVADWYDPAYYGRSPRSNPRGPSTETGRLQRRADRGGGWCFGAESARVAARHAGPGDWDEGGTADCLGFRPVMEM